MDTITIRDLAVSYRVGVPDAERSRPQRLLLTIELVGDFATAAANDDLSVTIDYDAVTQRLLHFGEGGHSWKLIEHWLGRASLIIIGIVIVWFAFAVLRNWRQSRT